MRYLGEDERIQQMMGIGYLGEIRRGPDGHAYQWVQGVDGLGNPIGGFWSRLARRVARGALKSFVPAWALKAASPFLRQALPWVQRVASYIPIPQAQAIAAGLKYATPVLREAGVAGHGGLGALYQAPDGRLYQLQGSGEADDLRGLADDELRGFAEDDLRGLGALYQAPDGTLYQMHGMAETDDLRGFAEDELRGLDEADDLRGLAEDELRGLDEADELRGFAEDDLRGLGEADELRGLAEEDLRGLDEADELHGLGQGYVQEPSMNGLEAYVPDRPAGTRWFVPPAQPPEMWRPLW